MCTKEPVWLNNLVQTQGQFLRLKIIITFGWCYLRGASYRCWVRVQAILLRPRSEKHVNWNWMKRLSEIFLVNRKQRETREPPLLFSYWRKKKFPFRKFIFYWVEENGVKFQEALISHSWSSGLGLHGSVLPLLEGRDASLNTVCTICSSFQALSPPSSSLSLPTDLVNEMALLRVTSFPPPFPRE